ncbi:MAG: hypothetical protein OXC67_02065 [Flavobacteriaceae bacterium]|nr:hypothetical protein [Flavobacteriaceae bacterium]
MVFIEGNMKHRIGGHRDRIRRTGVENKTHRKKHQEKTEGGEKSVVTLSHRM